MKSNESPADRVVRVVLALIAVAVAFVTGPSSLLGIILFVVAAVLLITAITGFCPLYRVLGMSTKKKVTS